MGVPTTLDIDLGKRDHGYWSEEKKSIGVGVPTTLDITAALHGRGARAADLQGFHCEVRRSARCTQILKSQCANTLTI